MFIPQKLQTKTLKTFFLQENHPSLASEYIHTSIATRIHLYITFFIDSHLEEDAKMSPSNKKKSEEEEDEFITIEEDNGIQSESQSQSQKEEFSTNIRTSSVWEIEEECFEISTMDDHDLIGKGINLNGVSSLSSIKEESDYDVVYVGVGKGNSSMDALLWSLNNINVNNFDTLVFLIHVYPELRFIPTPLGKLPITQVNPQQKETYLNQERIKRRDFLQKYLDVCSASKVKVETILIESDMEAKALLDLIPILNIKKLVLGITKSSLRKLKSRKGNGIADQILQNAPELCEVKIICEGAVVDTTMAGSPTPSLSPSLSPSETAAIPTQIPCEEQNTNSFGCTCFKSKVIK